METSFIWWDLKCLHLLTWRSVSWEGVRAWVLRALWGRPSSAGVRSVQVFRAPSQMCLSPWPTHPLGPPFSFLHLSGLQTPSTHRRSSRQHTPSLRAAPFGLLSNANIVYFFFYKIISGLIQWVWGGGGVISPEIWEPPWCYWAQTQGGLTAPSRVEPRFGAPSYTTLITIYS